LAGLAGALLLVLVTLTAGSAWSQGSSAGRSDVVIVVDDGRLSARVGAAPLEEVLQAIVAQTDLAVEVSGELGDVRPQEFSALTFEAALRRLIGDRGLVMIYDQAEGHQRRLAKVRVYGYLVPDPAARQAAAQRVRVRSTREAASPNSYADLAGKSKDERLRAVGRLARAKDQASREVLTAMVAQDPEAGVRRAAVSALGKIGGAEVVAAIDAALLDPEAEVRLSALRTLHGLQGEEAAPRLSAVALGDQDSGLRRQAILLLGSLKSDEAWSTIEAATSDSDPAVRQAAERALARRP
jgi:hypothetical protein